MDSLINFTDKIIKEGPNKYLMFISQFFLVGFTSLLLIQGKSLFNIDFTYTLIISTMISSAIYVVLDITSYFIVLVTIKKEDRTNVAKEIEKISEEMTIRGVETSKDRDLADIIVKNYSIAFDRNQYTNFGTTAFGSIYIILLTVKTSYNIFQSSNLILDLKEIAFFLVLTYLLSVILIIDFRLKEYKRAIKNFTSK